MSKSLAFSSALFSCLLGVGALQAAPTDGVWVVSLPGAARSESDIYFKGRVTAVDDLVHLHAESGPNSSLHPFECGYIGKVSGDEFMSMHPIKDADGGCPTDLGMKISSMTSEAVSVQFDGSSFPSPAGGEVSNIVMTADFFVPRPATSPIGMPLLGVKVGMLPDEVHARLTEKGYGTEDDVETSTQFQEVWEAVAPDVTDSMVLVSYLRNSEDPDAPARVFDVQQRWAPRAQEDLPTLGAMSAALQHAWGPALARAPHGDSRFNMYWTSHSKPRALPTSRLAAGSECFSIDDSGMPQLRSVFDRASALPDTVCDVFGYASLGAGSIIGHQVMPFDFADMSDSAVDREVPFVTNMERIIVDLNGHWKSEWISWGRVTRRDLEAMMQAVSGSADVPEL